MYFGLRGGGGVGPRDRGGGVSVCTLYALAPVLMYTFAGLGNPWLSSYANRANARLSQAPLKYTSVFFCPRATS